MELLPRGSHCGLGKRIWLAVAIIAILILGISWCSEHSEEPNIAQGMHFLGDSLPLELPAGVPDFTLYGKEWKAIPSDLTLDIGYWIFFKEWLPNQLPLEYYKLYTRLYEPSIIGLVHYTKEKRTYWLYFELTPREVDSVIFWDRIVDVLRGEVKPPKSVPMQEI